MARENDALFIYLVNVNEWENTDGTIKIIFSLNMQIVFNMHNKLAGSTQLV
jgi:hypothetical protein